MNNQIKYRVWCQDHNEWEKDEIVLGSEGQVYHIDSFNCKLKLIRPEKHIVQFWTGLKDHKNKDIYDGDIINLCYSIRHERDSSRDYHGEYKVEFKNGEWKLIKTKVYSGEGDDHKNELSLWLESSDYLKNMGMDFFEVVGNISENPELLKYD